MIITVPLPIAEPVSREHHTLFLSHCPTYTYWPLVSHGPPLVTTYKHTVDSPNKITCQCPSSTPCYQSGHVSVVREGAYSNGSVELGNFSGGRCVQGERAHIIWAPRGLLGAQRHRRQHHCSSSPFPLSNSVGEAQDFVTRKRWLWNLGGVLRISAMANASLNCQVRSFCNDSSIPPHFLFLPILMILPFFPFFCSTFSLNLSFPSHLLIFFHSFL